MRSLGFITMAAMAAGYIGLVDATTYYVDCAQTSNGSGSSASPFNAVGSVNALTLQPGDSVLFQRGSTCLGQFAPQGKGSASQGVVIGAYGSGSSLPVINANGAVNAVLLNAFSYVTLQDLELTAPGDNTQRRRGVYLYAADAGVVSNITLQRLYIHDVRGLMPSTISPSNAANGKYANATGAIIIEAAGNTTPTSFNGVLVQDNIIRSVDRQGIYTWSNWCRRTALAAFWNSLCTQNWAPSTGFEVRNNQLYDIGGDGIVPKGYVGAWIHHNKLIGFNRRSGSPNAGLWTANSDDSLFQYNVVSGGHTTSDGMAYDVDHSTSGTVFEYNVSHDNEGGFFLICPYDKPTKNFVIRYNLSVNDKARVIQICAGQLVNGTFTKNTVIVGDGITTNVVQESTTASLDVKFTNNIIRKSGAGSANWVLNDTAFVVDHNAFYGVSTYAAATNTITASPGLAAPGLRDPKAYYLLSGYPSLGAGVPPTYDASQDFFGNPVSASAAPNLGFYAGAGTRVPVFIETFDAYTLGTAPNASIWPVTGGKAVIVADPAGDLGRSLQLTPQSTTLSVTRTFGAVQQGTVRVSIRAWANQTSTSLTVAIADASASPLASVSLGANGNVAYTDAGTTKTDGPAYTAGEWHLIEFDINLAAKSYQAYVDAVAITTDASNGPSSGAPSTLIITASGSSSVYYVDDVYAVLA
ncbi:pectin lyase fold/virulence factor [Gongronella butleri]|nr:pectin lyase fold/virulence factor [Gongronella butleri]